jgi:hypothetical protein
MGILAFCLPGKTDFSNSPNERRLEKRSRRRRCRTGPCPFVPLLNLAVEALRKASVGENRLLGYGRGVISSVRSSGFAARTCCSWRPRATALRGSRSPSSSANWAMKLARSSRSAAGLRPAGSHQRDRRGEASEQRRQAPQWHACRTHPRSAANGQSGGEDARGAPPPRRVAGTGRGRC